MVNEGEYRRARELLLKHDECGQLCPHQAWEIDWAWKVVASHDNWLLELAIMNS